MLIYLMGVMSGAALSFMVFLIWRYGKFNNK